MGIKVIKSVLFFAALYGAVLVFNHLNAWAGIALALVVIVIVINDIINFFKKQLQ